jgi:uncharacterized membrane protein YoaK (UPF0700 family)
VPAGAPTRTTDAAPTAPERTRDAFVVALTVVTGATDAIAFTRLGGVFTSVMTGNMVLLGVGLGRTTWSILSHAGLAVAAFMVGTMVGARIAGAPRPGDQTWPRPITTALTCELALFLTVAIVWWTTGSAPSTTTATVLLAISALALGLQSSAVLRLNVSGLSTTYLTGTLTTLLHTVTVTRRLKGAGRSLCVLIALVGGGALGAALATRAPVFAPLISLVLLTGVIALSEAVRIGAAPVRARRESVARNP